MLSKSLTLALLAAPLALSQSTSIDKGLSGMDASIRPGCPNTIQVEPIVLLNVSGETLMGPVQFNLAVYSNGLASFARPAVPGGLHDRDLQQNADPGPSGPPSTIAIAATVNLSIDEANQLLADLRRAGAHRLCDQEAYMTDCPLQTLTIMEARPDAVSHTFSYWGGIGAYSDVATVMDAFVETYFPGL